MNNVISGLFLTLLSLGTCVKAYQMDLGSASSPGPGFIPFGIAALLGLMALFLCIKGAVEMVKGRRGEGAFRGARFHKIALVLAFIVAYGIFLKFLGFLLSTFLFMLLLLWGVGRQGVRKALLVSVLTVVCAHLLFVTLFDLPLPRGTILELVGG